MDDHGCILRCKLPPFLLANLPWKAVNLLHAAARDRYIHQTRHNVPDALLTRPWEDAGFRRNAQESYWWKALYPYSPSRTCIEYYKKWRKALRHKTNLCYSAALSFPLHLWQFTRLGNFFAAGKTCHLLSTCSIFVKRVRNILHTSIFLIRLRLHEPSDIMALSQ